MDQALGVRISDQSDNNKGLQNITTDIEAALRMTELSFKISESIDRLVLWNARNLQDLGRDSRKLEAYRQTIVGLFASEKNFNAMINGEKDGTRERLKKLQLATSLLVTKFAKKKDNGSYTCFTKLRTNLETGEESATGDCSKESSKSEALFKEVSAILAKKYSSPLFADYAR